MVFIADVPERSDRIRTVIGTDTQSLSPPDGPVSDPPAADRLSPRSGRSSPPPPINASAAARPKGSRPRASPEQAAGRAGANARMLVRKPQHRPDRQVATAVHCGQN
jgi:hypothetical protein